jgi:hypothetical protein
MDILEKLPTMADDALVNLLANAERLEKAGTRVQRASAESLIPAIKAELAGRKAAKLERAAQTRRNASELRASRKKAQAASEHPA